MSKYTVEIYPNFLTFEIEAGNEEEATQLAKLEMAQDGVVWDMINEADYYVEEII